MIDLTSFSGWATVLIILFFFLAICYFFFGRIRRFIPGIRKSPTQEKRMIISKQSRQPKNAKPFFGLYFSFRRKRIKKENPVKLRVVRNSNVEPALKDDRARLYIVKPRSIK